MVDIHREEWLSLMLNELPERLLVLDETGHIIDSFGYSSRSVDSTSRYINRTLGELLPSAIAETLQQSASHALATGKTLVIQYSIPRCQQLQLSIEELEALQDVEEQWFESTLKPIQFSPGKKYLLWQERDITTAYLREAEFKKLSETDELTSILNRRAFLLGLEQEFTQSHQHLSCLMIDIDHFKEINDQVGHLSGDEVITQVAQICQRIVGTNDYIGRLGGEEFGVALVQTNAIQAYDIAEQIRASIEASPCTVDGHIIYPTVSIGISELNHQVTSVKELLVQSDKAMYYSKKTGRNQVTIYHDNLPDIQTSRQLNAKILRAS